MGHNNGADGTSYAAMEETFSQLFATLCDQNINWQSLPSFPVYVTQLKVRDYMSKYMSKYKVMSRGLELKLLCQNSPS